VEGLGGGVYSRSHKKNKKFLEKNQPYKFLGEGGYKNNFQKIKKNKKFL